MQEFGRGASQGDEVPPVILHSAVVCFGFFLIFLVVVIDLHGGPKLLTEFHHTRCHLYCLYIGAQVDGDFLELLFPLLLELFFGIGIKLPESGHFAQVFAHLLRIADGEAVFKDIYDFVSFTIDFLYLRLVFGFVAGRIQLVNHFLLLRVFFLELVEKIRQHFRLGFFYHGLGSHLYALLDVVAFHVVGVNQVRTYCYERVVVVCIHFAHDDTHRVVLAKAKRLGIFVQLFFQLRLQCFVVDVVAPSVDGDVLDELFA